jgi:sulfatase maturation enzyme AslB (radical SAM superfamily)
VNQKAIDLVFETAAELHQYCQEQSINFSFGMVTNGINLTRERVQRLVPLGFEHAQVTIDGDRETHNQTRPRRNGEGSYDCIMGNLREYAGLIKTDILSVVTLERVPAVYHLIDMLSGQSYDCRYEMLIGPGSQPDQATIAPFRYPTVEAFVNDH